MLLENKRLIITGVLTPQSIAFSVARIAQEQGARIVLTSFGKAMGLTEKSARRLPDPPQVLEMDANDSDHIERVAKEVHTMWGGLDGFLHAIAFAPADALGGAFLQTPWESAAVALRTSAYSLKAIAVGMLPLMQEAGGSIVSLDFDASVAWPIYDWMGVSKAALEAITRYLARYLGRHGIRVNCVSAGPLRTMAAKGLLGSVNGLRRHVDPGLARAGIAAGEIREDVIRRLVRTLLVLEGGEVEAGAAGEPVEGGLARDAVLLGEGLQLPHVALQAGVVDLPHARDGSRDHDVLSRVSGPGVSGASVGAEGHQGHH